MYMHVYIYVYIHREHTYTHIHLKNQISSSSLYLYHLKRLSWASEILQLVKVLSTKPDNLRTNPLNLYGERREPVPASSFLIATQYAHAHACPQTHAMDE